MKDKKFKLLLVSALSIGQAFSMDMSELDDQLGDLIGNKKSVVPSLSDPALSTDSSNGKKAALPSSEKKGGKKKPIWSSAKTKTDTTIIGATSEFKFNSKFMLNIPGKDPVEVFIDNNNSLAKGTDLVERYLDDMVDADKIVRNFASNIQSYNNKIKAVEKNKDLYTPMFITHINTKYSSLLEAQKNISAQVDAINKEKKVIKNHVDNISNATGIFSSDYETILSNLKDINDKLSTINQNYQELEAAALEVSEALKIFDEEAAANKKRVEELKAKKAAKDAAVDAATKAIAYREAKQKKNQVAIEAAALAEKKAQDKKQQAEELAKQKEAAAAKADAELKSKLAEVEAMKIDSLISKMNDLRNRANDVALQLYPLVEDIKKNADKYQDEFVNKVSARIEPKIIELQKEFNDRVKNINSMIKKMEAVDKERNQVLSDITSAKNSEEMIALVPKTTELLNKYTSQYKEVSELFDASEKIYNDLLTVYNDIQTSALNAKVVDPKAIAATLDVARAVRIRQVAMMPRVLELAYAVRHK